jgi:iron complex outermembrane receptor protein
MSIAYLNADISDATIIYSNRAGDELPPVVLTDNLPPLNGSPELTITASYSHMFEFADGGRLTARIDPRFVSEKTLQFQPRDPGVGLDVDKLNTEPDHMMVDASLTYYNPDDTWNINVYGKNLTNHAEKTGFYMNLEFMQIGAPRTFGAIVSARF